MRSLLWSLCVLALFAASPAAGAKPPVCPDGRFLQAGSIVPGAGSADGAFDTVVIQNGQISIESGCAATTVKLRGKKDGSTKVLAKWKQCGSLRKVRLKAQIVADTEA